MNKLKKRMKNEKGMTLVELLAVLVILGIIAAIAVPMVTTNIQESRNKANVNEALNIISAAKLAYFEDGKGTYEITNSDNGLSKYIDLDVDEGEKITVKFENNQWIISGHDANNIEGIDTDTENGLTEAELRAYLKDE